MKWRVGSLAIVVALVLAAAGCGGSQPARFYTLSATAVPEALPATRVAVLVDPVTIPASADQPQFVVQVASNRVEVDEFNRWASPLNDNIARVVASDLAIQLGTSDVAIAPLANFKPSYRVAIDIQRFESVKGEAAVIEAVWTVRKTASGEIRSGHALARETVQGDGFEALAAAHSRALARISSEITAAIRAEAAQSL